jgi:hypothetical protein
MRVNPPTGSMSVSALSQTPGAQSTGATSFQTRLAAVDTGRSSAGGPEVTGAEILQHATQEIRAMLRLQYELSKSTYSKVSNVMKTRHETAKNAIGNIR